MKKDFYELMDNYTPEEPKAQYDISAESVKRKAMGRIAVSKGIKEHRFTKKTIAAVTALSAAAVLGIAAAASSGVFFNASNFFSHNTLSGETKLLSESDMINIRSNMKEEHIVAKSEGAEIELTGSMYDENVIYLFCTMTLPEGKVLPDNIDDVGFDISTIDMSSLSDKEGGHGTGVYFADYNQPGSSTFDFTCLIMLSGKADTADLNRFFLEDLIVRNKNGVNGSHFQSYTLQKGKWLIPFECKCRKEMTELLNEPVTGKINVYDPDYMDKSVSKSIELSSVRLSPLSIGLKGKANDFEEMSYLSICDSLHDSVVFVMKDSQERSEVEFTSGGSYAKYEEDTLSFEMNSAFSVPVDISKIDYIDINGTKINVN